MKANFKYNKILILMMLMLAAGCKKTGFLDAKPNLKSIVPETLEDFRLLSDNVSMMNGTNGQGLCPGLGEFSSDNYYINDVVFDQFTQPTYKEVYTWGAKIFSDPSYSPEDWGISYRCIAYANIILDGLKKITPETSRLQEYNDIRGSALFFRAHMYYQLMQIFAPMYDKISASEHYGVPLRLNADIGIKTGRAKVDQIYAQIVSDLAEAETLLPPKQSLPTRPSKSAVYGFLARMYLSMQEYSKALEFANKCLLISNELMDYNSMSANNFFPFERSNKEIIFYSILNSTRAMQIFGLYYGRIDSKVYNSYASGDLRKRLFFVDADSDLGQTDNPGITFRGSYDGSDYLFAGIATDEIYLTRAECYAREGNVDAAMIDLNTLMRKRWDNTVPYPTFTAVNKDDALNQILTERRKELISRGLRWTDLRRLNKEGANITVARVHKGTTYTLKPNSLQYTFLIPNDVIDFNPGMPQNPR